MRKRFLKAKIPSLVSLISFNRFSSLKDFLNRDIGFLCLINKYFSKINKIFGIKTSKTCDSLVIH